MSIFHACSALIPIELEMPLLASTFARVGSIRKPSTLLPTKVKTNWTLIPIC
jgi:hypothetical protein